MKLSDDEKQEFYEAFIKEMREQGWAWFVIGKEVAILAHVLADKEK